MTRFHAALLVILIGKSSLLMAQRPNVVFILVDDMGYGDLGVLHQNRRMAEGKPAHRTPELDRMAAQGILLTRHYASSPVCAPSRASLMSGLHQGHQPIRDNQFDKALPDNHTLANMLKDAGYSTALVGKYGLQGAEWEAYPTRRGFDYFFGYVRHRDGHNHYPAHAAPERPRMDMFENDREISSQLDGAYTTDLFTAVAKRWIVHHRLKASDEPFFLMLTYDTPHAGLEVAPGPYPAGKGLHGGIQVTPDGPRYLNAEVDSINGYIYPEYRNPAWPSVQQRHASMMRRIDDAVGDLLQLLVDLGIDKETLVVFTSDNGPHNESYGYGDYQPTFFESYGPLDGIKRDLYEGGIRVPAIAWWPARIPAGRIDSTPSGFHDWMTTLADLSGISAPANADGVSLRAALTGIGEPSVSRLYFEYSVRWPQPSYADFETHRRGKARGQMQAVMVDGFKGVRYDIQSHADPFEIYDTLNDPGESLNLAGTSARFDSLQARMKDAVLRMRLPDPDSPRPYDQEPIPAYGAPDSTVSADQWMHIPATASYALRVDTSEPIVVRIHEILVVDADRNAAPGTFRSVRLHLEAGYHPIRVVTEGPGTLSWELADDD